MVSRAFIPAGGTCAEKPCWKANAKGFQYKDKEATPEGITDLKLKEGLIAGKATDRLKGSTVTAPRSHRDPAPSSFQGNAIPPVVSSSPERGNSRSRS